MVCKQNGSELQTRNHKKTFHKVQLVFNDSFKREGGLKFRHRQVSIMIVYSYTFRMYVLPNLGNNEKTSN